MWLKEHDLDVDLEIEGFGTPVRLDCDTQQTGKAPGRGVYLYINKWWCKIAVVRETICSQDTELLFVLLRHFYLPHEFPQLFLYIQPKANADTAAEIMERGGTAPAIYCPRCTQSEKKKRLYMFNYYVLILTE